MHVTRKQEKTIRNALKQWLQEGNIKEDDFKRLSESLTRITFDWRRLSQYAFWAALACTIIAFGSLFADNTLLEAVIEFFALSSTARIGIPFIFAIVFFCWGFKRQHVEARWHYSTESILFLGVICLAITLWQVGDELNDDVNNFTLLLILGTLSYGLIGYLGRSSLVWLFFLLSLGNLFGAETGYSSNWGAYWFGMNYPGRFVLFGIAMLILCFLLGPVLVRRNIFNTSKAVGLTYLFVSLWIMSIVGNSNLDYWYDTNHFTLLPWVLLFALVSIACIMISLKTGDSMLRRFGVAFLAINLYTRYFEYFWDTSYKVVFFIILAISLGLIGRYAEKIWQASRNGVD